MKKTILSLLVLLGLMMGAKAQNDTPLTFEAIAAGTVTLEKVGNLTPNSGVQYRMNETGDWLSYTYGTSISLQAGQKLQFRSTSSVAYAESGVKYSHFTCTADCYLYGNLGSLFNYDNSVPGSGCEKMFYGNTHIKNRTGNSLVLPATSLGGNCYREMFSGCTALTAAPALPATSLAGSCYQEMFRGCTALTAAPALPATSLEDYCYEAMFFGCTALTAAPELPATSLATDCYAEMFSGCTNLTTAPELPATRLEYECYRSMFSGCTALTAAPTLPASTLVTACYSYMFNGCHNLNYVRCLATDISANGCTSGWLSGVASTGTFVKFSGMEHWTTGDSGIPAGWTVEDYDPTMGPLTFEAIAAGTVTLEKEGDFTPNSGIQYRLGETGDWLSYSYGTGINLQVGDKLQFRSTSSVAYSIDGVYYSHFTCTADCYLYGSVGTLFNNASSLPGSACIRMFYGNTHIKNYPDKCLVLPATSVGWACYEEMFSGCTSLTSAPELPATSLAVFCYNGMFYGCTNLTSAPALPATSLSDWCYYEMFSGCTSLTTAPELPAATLVYGCYYQMFKGCTHLNYMTCLATNISASNCTTEWLSGVASTGTFVKNPAMTGWPFGDSGIPDGWTVEDYNNSNNPLTFQAVEAGTITVNLDEGANLDPIQYRLNGGAWTNVAWNTPIALSTDDVIRFRGNNGTCCDYVSIEGIWQPAGFHFECSNPCYVYGNMMSLIDQDNFATNTILTETHAFYRLFKRGDFESNTTILNHPSLDIVLPATTLTAKCYLGLFANCQGITRAPVLPATTMQEYCYQELFLECTALTTPPVLPATTLATGCYDSMFSSCTSLATAPILPATILASKCYYSMFFGCTNLTVAPELPATELSDWCYLSMFNGCTNLTTAPALPATTLAESCYDDMFKNCLNLTAAPELPATTLAESCYDGMFHGCKTLTTAPALPATTLAENCYRDMFNGCKKLTLAPALPATTLLNSCYYQMFSGCTKLNYVVCLATDISASNCVKNWLSNVSSSGTFVKNPNMENWPSGKSGIPSGWNLQDINTFTTNGNWNVAANWSNNAVPEAGSSVVIAANATIPSGYTANAKCIIVDEGKALTIADGGQLIHENAGVVATVQKNITGHGGNDNSGWNFVASPMVNNVTPTESNGFLANEYDLYYYDEPTHYWRNHEPSNNSLNPNFPIEPQKGYLYANSIGTTLSLTGTLRPSNEAVSISGLSHSAPELTGFNLVGNPFACNATIDRPCYTIQTVNGEQVIEAATNPTLHPCEGVMVQADAEHESVTFTKVTPDAQSSQPNNGSLQIALTKANTRGNAKIDNAIVSFNEGNQLEKFHFGTQKTNVYLPEGGKEYAIVCVGRDISGNVSTNEVPLNFQANENGTYTITVNPEGVEMNYLHLIDNMTGADVDLLATPSYTFQAKTTDYTSRFRMVFSSFFEDTDSHNEIVAFISNGEIIINGEGTLQVIDMLGRQLFAKQVSTPHSSLLTPNFPSGVYVLRLINGNDVKTQKIVVK